MASGRPLSPSQRTMNASWMPRLRSSGAAGPRPFDWITVVILRGPRPPAADPRITPAYTTRRTVPFSSTVVGEGDIWCVIAGCEVAFVGEAAEIAALELLPTGG